MTTYRPRRSALSSRHPAIPADAEQGSTGQEASSARGAPQQGQPATPEKQETEPLPGAAKAPARSKKMTVNISTELESVAKDAYWAVRDDYRTFSDWVAEAISAHIEETKRRAGIDELPARPSAGLPTGRPLG